jgi:PAS domain S-box-containing protein
MGTSGAVLLLACAAFVVHEVITFRTELASNVATLAGVVGDNCSAAVDFKDRQQATNTLAALATDPRIVAACIYTMDGSVFASYRRPRALLQVLPPPRGAGHEFADDHLHLFRDITVKGDQVGTIYLKSDLAVLSHSLARYLEIVAIVFVMSVGVALLLSHRLQRIVSGPILHLAEVARSVASKRDYSARARKQSNDELGDLVDGFNEMLAQIQQRDFALQAAHDTLEQRVDQRTRELEHSLSVLNATLESTADGILVVADDGKVVSFNEKFVKMWGLPAPLQKNTSDTALMSRVLDRLKDPDHFLERIRQLHSQPDAESHDLIEFKDGQAFERYSQPQRIAGKSVGRVWSFRDVTDRKLAEEALRKSDERFQLVARATNDAVWDWDILSNQLWWNQGFKALFGYGDEDIKPDLTSWTDRLHPDDHARVMQSVQRVLESSQTYWASEYRFRRADGAYVYIYDRGYVMRDREGKALRMVCAMVDITQRKRAEEELTRARDAAEAANRAKSQFLANMSHEIRTPMNAIIGMTQLTLATNLSGEQRSLLLTVQDSANTLLNVLNDILDFSKIEAGKMELQPIRFNLRERLEDTITIFSVRAHEKGLELACFLEANVPESIVGDAGRLRQVLVNLLGNAVKFTESGEVVLRVFVEERRDEQIRLHFAVTDTGIGIPKDKQHEVFEAFTQADNSATRNYGGTGLGLTISSQLIGLMNGKIWLESKPGLGSTFHFTAEFGVDPVAETAVTEIPALRGIRVLIVDDNATNRMVLDAQLVRWGMLPTAVSDGESALAEIARSAAAHQPFSLIIIDGMMPGMDGFTLARRITEAASAPDTTLMMLSSLGHAEAAARESGIRFCLSKPVRQSDLFDAIMTALGQRTFTTRTRAQSRKLIPSRALKILLAEDHPVNQRLAVAVLQNWGHTVTVTPNGREALEAWSREPFDLIVMDVQMPELNGLEATRAIRRMEQGSTNHIPIIAMTAHAFKGDREQCLASGMDGYVSKPINSDDLFATIESVLHPTEQSTSDRSSLDIRHFSFDRVLERVGGDHQLLKEVLQLFFQDTERSIENIGQAISRGDARELERAAHRLKGAFSNMELHAAAELASQLETMGQSAHLHGAHQLMRDITSQIALARPALEALTCQQAA